MGSPPTFRRDPPPLRLKPGERVVVEVRTEGGRVLSWARYSPPAGGPCSAREALRVHGDRPGGVPDWYCAALLSPWCSGPCASCAPAEELLHGEPLVRAGRDPEG